MTFRDVLFMVIGSIIGSTITKIMLAPKPEKPWVKVWRNGKQGFQFLGWHGEEPTDPKIRRKRIWPRKRDKKKTPEYEAAYQDLIKGEGLTPAKAWPKFAAKQGLDPNAEGLKTNFTRAMYRYIAADNLKP